MIRKSSIYIQFLLFSLTFLSLVYYIGLLQVRSFDSVYNIVIVFITMILIAPFRSTLEDRGCTIENLVKTKELARILFLGLILISIVYIILYAFNNINTTLLYLKDYPKLLSWINSSTNLGEHTFILKFMILFIPFYLLYLYVSYRTSKLLSNYKFALIPALYIALLIALPLFSFFSFQMSDLRTFTLLEWLISPVLILFDLIVVFVILIITSLILFFINPFFLRPLIKVLYKVKILSKIKLETVGLVLVAYIAPFLLIWVSINTFHIDIRFFHLLEFITISLSSVYISLGIMLIFLLISLPSVYFIFQILISYIFNNKLVITLLTISALLTFYGAIAYHKYNIHSYEQINHDIQLQQYALRNYFCDLKKENLEESHDLEKDVMLKQYEKCLDF